MKAGTDVFFEGSELKVSFYVFFNKQNLKNSIEKNVKLDHSNNDRKINSDKYKK